MALKIFNKKPCLPVLARLIIKIARVLETYASFECFECASLNDSSLSQV